MTRNCECESIHTFETSEIPGFLCPIFVAEKNTKINPPKLKGMTLVQLFHDAAFCICDEIEQQVDLFTVSDLFGDAFDGLGSIQLR